MAVRLFFKQPAHFNHGRTNVNKPPEVPCVPGMALSPRVCSQVTRKMLLIGLFFISYLSAQLTVSRIRNPLAHYAPKVDVADLNGTDVLQFGWQILDH